MECQATYRVELVLTARSQVEVQHEELRLDDLTRGQRCGFTAARGRVKWEGLEFFQEGGFRRVGAGYNPESGETQSYPTQFDQYRSDRLLLGVLGSQPFIDLGEGLRSIGCFNFHPGSIRKLHKRIGSPELAPDGSNLARAIEGLKEIDESTLERVRAYVKAVVPEIDSFDTVQYGDWETVKFRLHPTAGMPPVEFDAESMSDGTLRVLASLIAAFQIHLPHGPSVIAIEEPETALHPAAMRALVGAMDEATLRTQVLLTTHSPALLDVEQVRPKNVRVVQMIDGQTVIAAVDDASVEIVRRKLSTLGGLERDNLLEPDLDDLERQRHLSQSLSGSPV
jgi:hypothetical protein